MRTVFMDGLPKATSHRIVLLAVIVLGAHGCDFEENRPSEFVVWSVSDAHAPGNLSKGNRESLAFPILQSQGEFAEYPGFDWDVLLNAGDFTSGQFPPADSEGKVLVRQYRALNGHYREDAYDVSGNHDGDYYDLVDETTGGWFNKWLDPLGENVNYSEVRNEMRRFPVDGDREKYKFQAGNVLFLMLNDYNTAPLPVGRGSSSQQAKGGYPAGAITRETFRWWKSNVLQNQDKIIITVSHHVLKDTTTRSQHHGGTGLHNPIGGGKDGEGSGYLYYIIENPDIEHFEFTSDATDFMDFFESYYRQNGKPAIDMWIGAHSHAENPLEVKDGQGLQEVRAGVTFLQTSGLTLWHSGGVPMSRILTFAQGSNEIDIRTYVHSTQQNRGRATKLPVQWQPGFYDEAARTVRIRHPFEMPAPDTRPRPPTRNYVRVQAEEKSVVAEDAESQL